MATTKTTIGLTCFNPDSITSRIVINESGCWLWQGPVSAGYGKLCVCQRHGAATGFTMLAHRASYEVFRGAIPTGLSIDHLCMVKSCVNPDHLEPVTGAENTKRAWAASRSGRIPAIRCGAPRKANPRVLIHFRVSSSARQKMDAECKRLDICLGRLLDVLALSLPDA